MSIKIHNIDRTRKLVIVQCIVKTKRARSNQMVKEEYRITRILSCLETNKIMINMHFLVMRMRKQTII